MDTNARKEIEKYLGELAVQNICSVTRAKELETENATLRQMVTEERSRVQSLDARLAASENKVQELRVALENAQDQLGKVKAGRSSRRRPTT